MSYFNEVTKPLHLIEQSAHSAIVELRKSLEIKEASGEDLSIITAENAFSRPSIGFSDDDLWRALAQDLELGPRVTRWALSRLLTYLFGPKVSEASILDYGVFPGVKKGTSIELLGPYPAPGVFTVSEPYVDKVVMTVGLVANQGPFTWICGNFYSNHGYTDANGALTDTSVEFVFNKKRHLYTSKLYSLPRYGRVTVDKCSPYEESFYYKDYDLNSCLLHLKDTDAIEHGHRKWTAIRGTTLAEYTEKNSTSILVKDGTVFPGADEAPLITVAPVCNVYILNVAAPIVPTTPYLVSAIAYPSIEIATLPALPPGSYPVNNVHYIVVNTGAPSKGIWKSKTGVIIDSTHLIDASTDIIGKLVNPTYFEVVINRGGPTEETVFVKEQRDNILDLNVDSAVDPKLDKSNLYFDHVEGETVELFDVAAITQADDLAGTIVAKIDATNYTATLTFQGNAEGGSAKFIESEIIILTSANVANIGIRRKIIAYPAANQFTFDSAFPADLVGGDTFKLYKRYVGGIDNKLYMVDTSGFPLAGFTIVIDKGLISEETLWVDNSTSNILTILYNEDGNAFLKNDHDFFMIVEPAQLYVEGCSWEIYETQPNEVIVEIPEDCLKDKNLGAKTYLHGEVPYITVKTITMPYASAQNATKLRVLYTDYLNAIESYALNTDKNPLFSTNCPFVRFKVASAIEQWNMFTTVADSYQIGFKELDTPASSNGSVILHGVEETVVPLASHAFVYGHPFATNDWVWLRSSDSASNLVIQIALAIEWSADVQELFFNTSGLSDTYRYGDYITKVYKDGASYYVDVNLAHPADAAIAPFDILTPTFSIPAYQQEGIFDGPVTEQYLEKGDLYSGALGIEKGDFYTWPGGYLWEEWGTQLAFAKEFPNSFVRMGMGVDPAAPDAYFRLPGKQNIVGDLPSGSTQLAVTGSLWPVAGQWPFSVIVDQGNATQETLEVGGVILVGANTTLVLSGTSHTQYLHVDGTSVDLYIEKIKLTQAPSESPGSFVADFGFDAGAETTQQVFIKGTGAVVAGVLTDTTHTFDPAVLVGCRIVVTPAAAPLIADYKTQRTITFATPTTLTIWSAPGNDTYTYIVSGKYIQTDVGKEWFQTKLIGGYQSSVGVLHYPTGEGLEQEEILYTKPQIGTYVLFDEDDHTSQSAHSAQTLTILSNGLKSPKVNGASFPVHVYASYLEVLISLMNIYMFDTIKPLNTTIKIEEINNV